MIQSEFSKNSRNQLRKRSKDIQKNMTPPLVNQTHLVPPTETVLNGGGWTIFDGTMSAMATISLFHRVRTRELTPGARRTHSERSAFAERTQSEATDA
jgi:hypothetical protein